MPFRHLLSFDCKMCDRQTMVTAQPVSGEDAAALPDGWGLIIAATNGMEQPCREVLCPDHWPTIVDMLKIEVPDVEPGEQPAKVNAAGYM